jgi:hypothetical protein
MVESRSKYHTDPIHHRNPQLEYRSMKIIHKTTLLILCTIAAGCGFAPDFGITSWRGCNEI